MSNEIAHIIQQSLVKRHRKERALQWFGRGAIGFALLCVFVFISSIVLKGYPTFIQYEMRIDVDSPSPITNYASYIKKTIYNYFPQVQTRAEKRVLTKLISGSARFDLQQQLKKSDNNTGSYWVPVDDATDQYLKGYITPSDEAKISPQQAAWVDNLVDRGIIAGGFNARFFTNGDSRQPEMAGIRAALVGSLLVISVTLVLSMLIGVPAAVYLEEFAPKNILTYIVEININNLASVPSIVFGLLGLAVFITLFGLPRSTPIVASLTLTLMTLPTIILATRSALRTVPSSLKEAAYGLGASRMQVIFHHTLPYAAPGIMTGSIIGIAQALGETAPLIMIGMVAFITDVPQSIFDASSSLPVQIYLWADSPERAFGEKTAAAIMVLLTFLFAINIVAIVLRNRFDRKNMYGHS